MSGRWITLHNAETKAFVSDKWSSKSDEKKWEITKLLQPKQPHCLLQRNKRERKKWKWIWMKRIKWLVASQCMWMAFNQLKRENWINGGL